MFPIRSIICYNGGSGGDFLKTLCLQQINCSAQFQAKITSTGLTLHNDHYFKEICETLYTANVVMPVDLDLAKISPVENSHYYFDWFSTLTDKLYYINCPDDVVSGLVEIYIAKRHNGSLTRFVNSNKNTLPNWLQNELTEKTAINISSTLWLKQLKNWRSNPNLTAIELEDFFKQDTLQYIVEQLIKQPLTDIAKFNDTQLKWTANNAVLKNLMF